MIWRDLVDEATAKIEAAGVPDPASSALRIGQAATGTSGGEWLEVVDQDATKRQLGAFDAMVGRRCEGEPLQYVVGAWGFRTLDLFVDRRVLIPRPETESVAGAAIDELTRLRGRDRDRELLVADLGTGSGAIGLSLAAEVADIDVWLTDVSDDALAVARANLAGLGRRGGRVRLADGSWFDALPSELAGRFDLVVSNPPYVGAGDEIETQVVEWEPALALFADDDGTAHLRTLIAESPSWLVDDGVLVLEMAPAQVEPMAAFGSNYFGRVEIITDLSNRQRGLTLHHPTHL